MTHFSASKQRVRRVIRTILSRKVSERDAAPSMIEIWAMPEDGPPNGSGLSVGRGGAVFSEEVALGEGQGWRLGGGIESECVEGHVGDDFEGEGVFDGFGA
jgi:hypothetical protein